MTLTEFLLARIAEDEAAALKCLGRDWQANGHDVGSRIDEQPFDIVRPFVGGPYAQPLRQGGLDQHGANDERLSAAMHVARHDPARVLAEVEAKRRIVGRGPSECGGYEDQAELGSHHYPDPAWSHCDGCSAAESADRDWRWTLSVLALPYADHPDYDEAWRP